jgi:hypothetical protein
MNRRGTEPYARWCERTAGVIPPPTRSESNLTPKIHFLHIPKTAGSTFDVCLFLQYLRPYLLRQHFVFSGNIKADTKQINAMSSAARKRIAICTGHAPLMTGCEEFDAISHALRNSIVLI